ncbi:hypothetical protein MTP03_02800 [Tsukamurella sp. PLM1]|nr:hypothetical protein MTP03_02800 [Tsukamurella sp. PLM1]
MITPLTRPPAATSRCASARTSRGPVTPGSSVVPARNASAAVRRRPVVRLDRTRLSPTPGHGPLARGTRAPQYSSNAVGTAPSSVSAKGVTRIAASTRAKASPISVGGYGQAV